MLLDGGGLALITGIALAIGVAYAVANIVPVDTDMYWRAGLSSHYYGTVWAADANSLYVYPPPLAQAIGLLAPIGWSAFVIGWTVFVFAGMWASTRRWSLLVFAATAGAAILVGHRLRTGQAAPPGHDRQRPATPRRGGRHRLPLAGGVGLRDPDARSPRASASSGSPSAVSGGTWASP